MLMFWNMIINSFQTNIFIFGEFMLPNPRSHVGLSWQLIVPTAWPSQTSIFCLLLLLLWLTLRYGWYGNYLINECCNLSKSLSAWNQFLSKNTRRKNKIPQWELHELCIFLPERTGSSEYLFSGLEWSEWSAA